MKGLTPYQLEILENVRADQAAGGCVDLDQLLDRLSWHPSKQSLQFTIRALIAKKVIAKTDFIVRRGRKRVCFVLTPEGQAVFDPRGPAAAPEAPERPADPPAAPAPEVSETLPPGGSTDDGFDGLEEIIE